jgi:hypothetical protein
VDSLIDCENQLAEGATLFRRYRAERAAISLLAWQADGILDDLRWNMIAMGDEGNIHPPLDRLITVLCNPVGVTIYPNREVHSCQRHEYERRKKDKPDSFFHRQPFARNTKLPEQEKTVNPSEYREYRPERMMGASQPALTFPEHFYDRLCRSGSEVAGECRGARPCSGQQQSVTVLR